MPLLALLYLSFQLSSDIIIFTNVQLTKNVEISACYIVKFLQDKLTTTKCLNYSIKNLTGNITGRYIWHSLRRYCNMYTLL